MRLATLIALTLLMFSVALTACDPPTATPPPTVAEMIAVIDGERMDSAHAKRADFLLSRIANWCADSPSEKQVGDMAATTKNILREDYGLDRTVLDVLEAVNESVDSTTAGFLPCASAFALYVTLSGR